MKKLLTLIALVGMGAFMAGCAEEKPAAPAGAGSTPTMHGPGAVGSPPMHNPLRATKCRTRRPTKVTRKTLTPTRTRKRNNNPSAQFDY